MNEELHSHVSKEARFTNDGGYEIIVSAELGRIIEALADKFSMAPQSIVLESVETYAADVPGIPEYQGKGSG